MTIDEAIIKHRALAESIDEIGDGSGFREVADMLEELKWYRENNLIKREEALERITHLQRLEKHEDHVITLCHSYCAVAEIPKAEPPKE